MKVQISIDDKLLSRIDRYADEMSLSRSGSIALGMTNYLNQQEMIFYIREVTLALKKIAETGNVDEESMKKFEEFETLAKYFVGK